MERSIINLVGGETIPVVGNTGKSGLQGILFDLDGTLVDSLRLTFDGFNHAFQTFGLPRLTPAEIMAHFGPGEKEIFRKIVGDAAHEQASAAYHAYVRSRMQETPLFPGVAAILEELRSLSVPVGIVTGRGRQSTDYILAHHGLDSVFETVITHDDVSVSKPSPEGILKALDHLGLAPEKTAYVGDMWVDVRAAHHAGCMAVSVTWDSAYDRSRVEYERPHLYLDSPEELRRLMRAD